MRDGQDNPSIMRFSRKVLFVLLALCVAAYLRGLAGGFLFDDFPNIVHNPALRSIETANGQWAHVILSSAASFLHRPISMLSFAANIALFGMNTFAFKTVNLCIHLLNGILVFRLVEQISKRLIDDKSAQQSGTATFIALLVSGIWLLHPLQVSTVLYIVQRMNLLATTFMLCGLLCYVHGRSRMQEGKSGLVFALSGLCLFGVLATLSKENGALITSLALLIEWSCFQFDTKEQRQGKILKAFYWITVALPLMIVAAYLLLEPQWLATRYGYRDFTLGERLLTQCRVLSHYLLWVFFPDPSLMGMYHDDIPVSKGLLDPLTTILGLGFWLLAIIAAYWTRHRCSGLLFGIAWFLIGQSMESTVIPLEMTFEHRNYLPMIGLLAGLACVPWQLKASRVNKGWLLGGSMIVICLAGVTAWRAAQWRDSLVLAMHQVADHPKSARSQFEAGQALIFSGTAAGAQSEAEHAAIPYFQRSASLNKTYIYPVAGLLVIQSRENHTPSQTSIDALAATIKITEPTQVEPFLVILTGATEGSLLISRENVELLVDSALANPRFTQVIRATILDAYGHYQFQAAHNNQAAIDLTLAAAAEDPQNPQFQINLVKLALALGDPKQAAVHLQRAAQLDKAGIYDGVINDLKRQMGLGDR